MLLMR